MYTIGLLSQKLDAETWFVVPQIRGRPISVTAAHIFGGGPTPGQINLRCLNRGEFSDQQATFLTASTHKSVSMSIKRAIKAMTKSSTILGKQSLKILSLSRFPGVLAAFHGVPFLSDAGD